MFLNYFLSAEMKIEQLVYSDKCGWDINKSNLSDSAKLVYVFGSRDSISKKGNLNHLYKLYPKAKFIGCSTSGEINGKTVSDDKIVATAVQFEKTIVKSVNTTIESKDDSYNAGVNLVEKLEYDGLKHVFVLSEGLNINGDELVKGISEVLGQDSKLTGFYSYCEISPIVNGTKCELHNQSMTIAAFAEE